jgi:hypothetical protein
MESSPPKRRFPPPWTVKQSGPHAFIVEDANGVRLAAIYCCDDLHKQRWANYTEHLTSDEARRIAKPPRWMSSQQAAIWRAFEGEAPWLNYSHRSLLEIASVARARPASGDEVGVQAMGLLRLCIGSMGLTPTDASKISWSPMKSRTICSTNNDGVNRKESPSVRSTQGRQSNPR